MDAAPIPVETLLAHREWVRCVARAVVRDPNAADDVEQETWLAALRSPPRSESSLRAWFGTVTRSRARRIGRTEMRRGAREAAVARDEATTSAADLAEIADTHRRVVQAVVELAEPYRQTVLLRYFEGLAVDEVAKRTGVPLDTARSRISRGLAQLRERLTRELGRDERPWDAALVPLIGEMRNPAAGAATGAAAAGGGAIMATKTAWVLASVLVVAGIGAFALTREPAKAIEPKLVAAAPVPLPAPPPAPADDPKGKAPAPPAPAPEPPEPAAKADDPKPAAPALTAQQKLDRINITASWNDTPVVEVLGEISARVDVDFFIAAEIVDPGVRVPRLTIDMENAGSATLVNVVASIAGLTAKVEESRVVVLPGDGKRDETRPLVPIERLAPDAKRTITVKGVVVDEQGAPIGSAAIRSMGGLLPLAATSADGTFRVEIGRPFGSVYASVPGRIPSWAFEVQGKYGDVVELKLALRGVAARVEGAVTEADGRAVAGAGVEIVGAQTANGETPPSGAYAPGATRATTDENGRFTADTLVPGEFEISVQPRSGPGARTKATAKPGETVHVDVRLPLTLVWRGTLRDADGKPIAKASISAGGHGRSGTNASGAFEIAGLTPGRVQAQIHLRDGSHTVKWIDVQGSGEFRSDLVVGGGARIAGHVVDADGGALAGCWVHLLPLPQGAGGSSDGQRTDDRGAFDLTDVEPGSYRVEVCRDSRLPLAVSADITTGGQDVEIRVPRDALVPAKVHARVVGADGKPVARAELFLRDAATGREADASADGIGAVGLANVPRGRYLVWLRCAQGAIELPARDVAAGADVDLGTVRLPVPVSVPLRWDVTGDVTSSVTWLRWWRVLSEGSSAPCKDSGYLRGTPTLSELQLPPGRYRIRLEGSAVQGAERTFDVAPTGTVPVTLPLRAAPLRKLALRFPGEAPGRARLRVSDQDGLVAETALHGAETSLRLVPGRFRIDVDVAAGQTLTGTLEVPEKDAPETFDVVLR